MKICTIGIDLGKTVFHLIGLDEHGKVIAKKKCSRSQLLAYTANIPAALIGMEACCGSHHLGAALAVQGHQVRLIPPQFVKPFVKSNKNDYNDAEAIAEAVLRPRMRFVPIKTNDQLDLQALHRVRDRLVRRRTGIINQIRAFLLERGIAFRAGRVYLRSHMAAILEDAELNLSPLLRGLLEQLWEEWKITESRIEEVTDQLEVIADQDTSCKRLQTVPGVGPLVSTALVAAIGNGSAFAKGREFSAWLGLVPRQVSTGGKPKLLGISKRGNSYLRRLFIHGARAILIRERKKYAFGGWMTQLESRAHANVVAVAVANKLARIAWAVLVKGENYRRIPAFSASNCEGNMAA